MRMKRGGIAERFDKEDFENCLDDLGSNHDEPYNQTIYRLFKQDPEHLDVKWTFTKVAGLDKLYSAQLDQYLYTARKKTEPDWLVDETDVHYALAKKILDGRRKKRFLNLLPPNKTSRSRLRITDLPELSKKVIGLAAFLKDLCGWGDRIDLNGTISFSAKYLHFHSGIVPVFDRRASTTLYNMETGRKVQSKKLEYGLFCELFGEALKRAYPKQSSYTPANIKNLDGYLYYVDRKDWSLPASPKEEDNK
jgi:hypothetical protein